MPLLSWSDVVERRSELHLVAGVLPHDPTSFPQPDARTLHEALRRLLSTLPLQGPYGASIVRSGSVVEIACAFDRREDSDCLAALVPAVPGDQAADWASTRRFLFDDEVRARLMDLAGPSRKRGQRRSVMQEGRLVDGR